MPLPITDEYMQEMRKTVKNYAVIILHKTDKFKRPEVDKIIWEHGRRNYQLRAEGALSIVCPITDETDVCGICIVNTSTDEAKKIYEDDPGVKAGIFTFEVHPCRSFPGDALAK